MFGADRFKLGETVVPGITPFYRFKLACNQELQNSRMSFNSTKSMKNNSQEPKQLNPRSHPRNHMGKDNIK